VILTGLASAGCETFGRQPCDTSAEGNPTVTYAGGTTADGVYMTSPWTGPLLSWPGGQHYQLDHSLGATPSWVHAYLSFEESGLDGGVAGGGNVSLAAGNDVEILGMDDQSITVANDTCSAYWLLVVAGTGAPP